MCEAMRCLCAWMAQRSHDTPEIYTSGATSRKIVQRSADRRSLVLLRLSELWNVYRRRSCGTWQRLGCPCCMHIGSAWLRREESWSAAIQTTPRTRQQFRRRRRQPVTSRRERNEAARVSCCCYWCCGRPPLRGRERVSSSLAIWSSSR